MEVYKRVLKAMLNVLLPLSRLIKEDLKNVLLIFLAKSWKKCSREQKQGFIFVIRDGIDRSYEQYKTCSFDYSVRAFLFGIKHFCARQFTSLLATDLRVPRRYFVQNLQQYWFVQYIISAIAGAG